MNIVLLDAKTMGDGVDLTVFSKFGNFKSYDITKDDKKILRAQDADIIITNKVIFDKKTLKELPKLKLICLLATGMNNIDLEYAKKRGIEVKNVAGYSTNSVTQHTFALVLSLMNKIYFYDNYVKSGNWTKSKVFTNLDRTFYEISGKKWGIIGLGTIGREVAKIANAFGCEVCYYSTSGIKRDEIYKEVTLKELLKTCDIVSIHAPLNEKTKNLLDKKELSLMKQDAILINVGRGGIINENALKDVLEKEKIYAGLDVLEIEPMSKNSPLKELTCKERFIITPHIAWGSIEARTKLVELVCKNIENFLKV